jgi:hypothetical protein
VVRTSGAAAHQWRPFIGADTNTLLVGGTPLHTYLEQQAQAGWELDELFLSARLARQAWAPTNEYLFGGYVSMKRPPTVTRTWEYLTLSASMVPMQGGGTDPYGNPDVSRPAEVFAANGTALAPRPKLSDYLNARGQEGWEFIAGGASANVYNAATAESLL